MTSETQLIFVYNADSGRLNAYLDMLHKVFSPKTYPCSLCAITYGPFAMRKEWEEFIKELPFPVRFLHRDEWETEFERRDELPAVFVKQGEIIKSFLNADTLNKMTLEDLMNQLRSQAPVLS